MPLRLMPLLALMSLSLWTAIPSAAAAPPEAQADTATGFVEVPGGRLWYEARGQGEPLLLLHDGLTSSAAWDEQAAFFSRTFRTVRYDRRGFGRSEPAAAPYSDIEDLAAVFAALKLDRAILMGCSDGSKLAVDFTLAHPEQVVALVLVGPVVSGLPYSEHFLRRGLVNFRPVFMNQDVAGAVDAWVRDPYLVDAANPKAKERLRELLTASPGPASGALLDSSPPERPAAGRLGEIHVPTLILVGASDIPDVHSHAGVLAAGIDRSRRVVIPGAGHLAFLEKPQELNALVFEALRPVDAAAAYLKSLASSRIFEESRHLFDYDAKAPLDVKEVRSEQRGDVRIVDLSYASPGGGRVPAFLVLPPKPGKSPAAVFLHPGQGDRMTFLDEAVELAGRGLVSLTITAPFLRPENKERPRLSVWDPEIGRKEQIQTIVDVRRGFDLLAARPEVDPARLAYVGHSLGATVGGTLAGVEKRPVAFVLMAGLPSLTHSYAEGHDQSSAAFQIFLTPDQQRRYVASLGPVDAVHYIGHAAPAKLLFQFAHRDEFISDWDAAVYLQAASQPKEVQWFDTGHAFNEDARMKRGEWLGTVLGLAPAQ